MPGGVGRVGDAVCCGNVVGGTGAVGKDVAKAWALELIGVPGRLHGAESLDEVDREWRRDESWPSLLSSPSMRRRCDLDRFAELVCCGEALAVWCCGTG